LNLPRPLESLPRQPGLSRDVFEAIKGETAMYVVTVNYQIKPEYAANFQEAMLVNARSSLLNEPGCRRFDLSVDENDSAHFFLFEVYDDEAAFQKHTTTDHFATVNRVIEPWVRDKSFKMFRKLG
jgi:quinol monooxygenase YgiN